MDSPGAAAMSQSMFERSPMKVPEGGQATSRKTAPATTSPVKEKSSKVALDTASRVAQMHTAAALSQADGATDSATRALSQKLIGMVDKKEGFKSLVAVRLQPSTIGLVCHDASQIDLDKGVDHSVLARNLAIGLRGVTTPGVASMHRPILTAMWKKPNTPTPPTNVVLYGTRLLRDNATKDFRLEPSGSYGFNSDAMGAVALAAVATLHANLLLGADIPANKLQGHLSHPGMQALVDAIKEQMQNHRG